MSPAQRLTTSETGSKKTLTPKLILTAVRRRWKSVFLGTLLLTALGGAISYLMFEPQYSANAWFRISKDPIYVAFPQRTGQADQFLANQIEALRSPMVLENALQKVGNLSEFDDVEEPVTWLAQHLEIRPVGKSEYLSVAIKSSDPSHAKQIIDAVASEYMTFHDQIGLDSQRTLIKTLKDRQSDHSKMVAELHDDVQVRARQAAGNDPLANRSTSRESPAVQTLAQINQKLMDASVEAGVLAVNIKKLQERYAKEPIAVSEQALERVLKDDKEVQQLESAIAENHRKLASYGQTAVQGTRSSAYVSLSEKIQAQEKELEALRSERIAGLKERVEGVEQARRSEALRELENKLESARALESVLKAEFEKQLEATRTVTVDTLEMELKRSELDRAWEVMHRIEQRVLEVETESRAPDRVELVKVADLPQIPLERFPWKWLVLSVVGALVVPLGLVVAAESLMRRVSSRDELEKSSALTVVGEIPSIATSRTSRKYERQIGPYQESINSLGTLLFLSEDTKATKVLSVASAVSGEGKTSVAAQLAMRIASTTHEKVLLIDGDMRCPDLHRVFDVGLTPGLVDLLEDSSRIKSEDVVVELEGSDLHLLPAGRLASSPHRLLSHTTFSGLLEDLGTRYRYIVIDTPPVLSASESLHMHKAADACLICAMRDVTRLDQFNAAHDRLLRAGARPVGAVLSGVSWTSYSYRYGGYAYQLDEAANEL